MNKKKIKKNQIFAKFEKNLIINLFNLNDKALHLFFH